MSSDGSAREVRNVIARKTGRSVGLDRDVAIKNRST